MVGFFVDLFFVFLILLVVGLFNPKLFGVLFKKNVPNRKKTSLLFGTLSVVSFLTLGIYAALIDGENTEKTMDIKISKTTGDNRIYGALGVGMFAQALSDYSEARIYTDALFSADTHKISYANWKEQKRGIIKKWDVAQATLDKLNEVIKIMPDGELSFVTSPSAKHFTFDPIAGAESIADEVALDKAVKAYNSVSKDKLETASKILGKDMRETKKIFDELNKKDAENAEWWIGANDTLSKAATATEVACDATLFVGGLIVGGPIVGVGKYILTAAVGTDMLATIGDTTMDIGIANDTKDRRAITYITHGLLKPFTFYSSLTDLKSIKSTASKLYTDIFTNPKGKIEAIKGLLKDSEYMKELKKDISGHIATVKDWGKWVLSDEVKNFFENKTWEDSFKTTGRTHFPYNYGENGFVPQKGQNEIITLRSQIIAGNKIQVVVLGGGDLKKIYNLEVEFPPEPKPVKTLEQFCEEQSIIQYGAPGRMTPDYSRNGCLTTINVTY